MNNPIEYIEKCTLEDLLEFRKLTVKEDGSNSTRWGDLAYIANFYLNYSYAQIARKFKKSRDTIESQISVVSNGSSVQADEIDDLMREIAYWRYKKAVKSKEQGVVQFSLTGEEINRFTSGKLASEITDINKGNIASCCKQKIKSAGGFIWRYINE